MPKNIKAAITLGEGWRQFAFQQDDLRLLGTIRRGIEIGALAQDGGGHFFQVNGDIRQPLNTSRVQALMQSARTVVRPPPIVRQPSAEQRAAVVVTVKPKRRLASSQ